MIILLIYFLGVFFIFYFIMLFVEGMLLLYLEFVVGQYFRKGSMGIWNLVYFLLGGVGIVSAVIFFIVGVYYNVIIMWCFFYLVYFFIGTFFWFFCFMEIQGNLTVLLLECDVSGFIFYFWYRNVLEIFISIEDIQGVKWKMFLCLIFVWGVVYVCIWKGIKFFGKVIEIGELMYIKLFLQDIEKILNNILFL